MVSVADSLVLGGRKADSCKKKICGLKNSWIRVDVDKLCLKTKQFLISINCVLLPQDAVGCFWSDMPSCTGEVITQWRAWVLQLASLETFLGICPGDYLNLQRMYDALPEDCKNTFSCPFCYLV